MKKIGKVNCSDCNEQDCCWYFSNSILGDRINHICSDFRPNKTSIRYKIKKINFLDLLGTLAILSSLYLVTVNNHFWLLYSIGCFIYAFLLFKKKLFFGCLMNAVAIIISVGNFFRG